MKKTPQPATIIPGPVTLAETAARAVEGRILLTYRDAARVIGFSVSKTRKLVAEGELVAAGEGRARRVTAASILVYVAGLVTSDCQRPRAMDAA